MPCIGTTRFNSRTWEENKQWREKNKHEGCIYGSPMRIKENIYVGDLVFILEMNNDINKIEGIGIIKNTVYADKSYRIYKDGNYNRFIYKSDYRIDRKQLTRYEEKILELFDILVFKGSKHLKRGQGITQIPKWISENKHFDFIKFFKKIFIKHLRNNYETLGK